MRATRLKAGRHKQPHPLYVLAVTMVLIAAVATALLFAPDKAATYPAEAQTPRAVPVFLAAPSADTAESATELPLRQLTVESAADATPEPEPAPEPQVVDRYAGIVMTQQELDELAAILYLECGNQSADCQQADAEVVFNRVINKHFPSTVHDVLHQGAGTSNPQFTTISSVGLAAPSQAQYDAIHAALYGPSILPPDVVFFSLGGENERVWGTIGTTVYCYEYIWD